MGGKTRAAAWSDQRRESLKKKNIPSFYKEGGKPRKEGEGDGPIKKILGKVGERWFLITKGRHGGREV